jgi:hypothetical protein
MDELKIEKYKTHNIVLFKNVFLDIKSKSKDEIISFTLNDEDNIYHIGDRVKFTYEGGYELEEIYYDIIDTVNLISNFYGDKKMIRLKFVTSTDWLMQPVISINEKNSTIMPTNYNIKIDSKFFTRIKDSLKDNKINFILPFNISVYKNDILKFYNGTDELIFKILDTMYDTKDNRIIVCAVCII